MKTLIGGDETNFDFILENLIIGNKNLFSCLLQNYVVIRNRLVEGVDFRPLFYSKPLGSRKVIHITEKNGQQFTRGGCFAIFETHIEYSEVTDNPNTDGIINRTIKYTVNFGDIIFNEKLLKLLT